MPLGDVLPEIAVLVTAVIGLLLASFAPMRRQWLGAPLALIGLALAGVLCAMQWSGQPRLTFSGTWALDGASIAARLIILAATAIAVLLAPEWFRHERRHGEYYSMLLLSALSPDIARARGVRTRLVGIAYLIALAVDVSLSAVAIGAVLSTALLIGPAATALIHFGASRSPVRSPLPAPAAWVQVFRSAEVHTAALVPPWVPTITYAEPLAAAADGTRSPPNVWPCAGCQVTVSPDVSTSEREPVPPTASQPGPPWTASTSRC